MHSLSTHHLSACVCVCVRAYLFCANLLVQPAEAGHNQYSEQLVRMEYVSSSSPEYHEVRKPHILPRSV